VNDERYVLVSIFYKKPQRQAFNFMPILFLIIRKKAIINHAITGALIRLKSFKNYKTAPM